MHELPLLEFRGGTKLTGSSSTRCILSQIANLVAEHPTAEPTNFSFIPFKGMPWHLASGLAPISVRGNFRISAGLKLPSQIPSALRAVNVPILHSVQSQLFS